MLKKKKTTHIAMDAEPKEITVHASGFQTIVYVQLNGGMYDHFQWSAKKSQTKLSGWCICICVSHKYIE